jgi:hypothetical protein
MASGGATGLGQMHVKSPERASPEGEGPRYQGAMRIDVVAPHGASPSPEASIHRIADVRCHLETCAQTLRELEAASENGQRLVVGVSPITIRMLAACLAELLKLEWTQPHRDSCHDLCKLLDCPQQPVLRNAIQHAIEILETTKCRFKSKELKRLREDLETLLGNSQDFSPSQNP